METLTREKALNNLLQPITWNWGSSIKARQDLVSKRFNDVRTAYPFLTDDEKAKADKWKKDESHSGLWD